MSQFKRFSLFTCAMLLASSLVLAQVDLKKKNPALGLNPPVSPGLTKAATSLFQNIRVLPSSNHQSETSISIYPTNSSRLLGGANTDPGQGYYYSTDSGNNWSGSDRLLQTSANSSDPAVAFDRLGNAYFNYLDSNDGINYTLLVAKSTNGGITWQNPVTIPTSTNGPDKNYIAVDTNPASLYQNYVYAVWTDFPGSNPIRFSRSTDGGQSFAGNLNISGGSTVVQGAVPAVGPNGEVYVVWGIGNPNETAIGFNKSTNGGISFVYSSPPTITSVTQIGTLINNRYRLKSTQIRVNSFPSIAVDRSGGPNNGTIYVAWADQRSTPPGSGTPDIFLINSVDGGSCWSSPVRVNDVTTGDQWFPWINVGPDGVINVVFYDSRNDPNNLLTEVYVARSVDGGQTFANYKVSDTQFTPNPIAGYASGYMGDYIGITSSTGKAHPFWMDNRTNGVLYQAFTAVLDFQKTPMPKTVFPASSGGNTVRLTWTNPSYTGFTGVLIWRKVGSAFTDVKPTQGSPPSQAPPAGITSVWYGNNTTYTDANLTQGTTYYYQLYSYDSNYNYSVGAQVIATPHKTTSTSTVATASNNQRKMVYDGTYYYLVYESGGEIYYTYSNDNGSTWSNELQISDGNGGNKYPSIDIVNQIIVVVWQQEYPTAGKICMRRKTASGWQCQQQVVSFFASAGFTATPVVVATGFFDYHIIWHDYSSNNLSIRTYNENNGWVTNWTAIPSTNSNSFYPALAQDTYTNLHLAWAESGTIYYTKIQFNGSSYTFSPSKEDVSSGTGYSGHVYPSITTDYSRRPSVAWEAYSNVLAEEIILHRRRELSGSWSSATSFAGNDDYYKPSIMSYPNVANNQKLRITWWGLTNLIKLAKYDGTSWTQFTESATGYDPNISFTMNGSEAAKIVLRSSGASPYTIITTSQNLPKTTGTNIAHYRRGVMRIGKVELSFDVGDFYLQSGGGVTPIDLFAYNDTLVVGLTGEWNDMFRTEPVTLPANSVLVFQNGFSVVNPQLLGNALPPGASVSFALEAVRATTNTPLATLYKQVVSRVDTSLFWGKRQFQVPSTLAGQPVYLRVAVSTLGSIVAKPSLVEIYQEVPDSSGLGKPEPASGRALSKIFALYPNYPNPVNPETVIRFDLPEQSEIDLAIFNALGEKVKTLINGRRGAGRYVEVWDGRNARGEPAASGVYFMKLLAGDFIATQKMILLR